MKLNNTSEKPLYFQLKQVLKEDILRGKYKPGEKLPPESEICNVYGVSRITSRRAITDLVQEGVLYTMQGKGTFVKELKEKRELISVGGFSEMTNASGKQPSSQILSSQIIQATEEMSRKFHVKFGDAILKLHRLLYIEEALPFIIETSYFPLDHFPQLEKHIGAPSTYQILKEKYKVEFSRSEKTLEVVSASEYEADLFKCDLGFPLFSIEKLTYDSQDRPIHYSQSLYMTNRVVFNIDVDQKK
ncbi:UTRA domain-containing protein [Domibacillus enclensis]|uniref:Transcriptional regulator n=1 Tax=Domibacillus enclensis TaxID=1017273 RepID=A0A1N7C3B2_9BACI|nr:UTRA domain-containing protein [Domibacillus enclensis]OXS74222.1 transcriptional regulator [Domibacillus enclensis]SIR58079.1 GntR family transcriptional regulator, frlABCD operon transcriptional regulator [Domibacillus enclensis]